MTTNTPPFQVGDDFDGDIIKSAECLADGVWFFGIEDQGFIWMSAEVTAKMPEPWLSAFPYSGVCGDRWIDWKLPKPRRRRKAIQ